VSDQKSLAEIGKKNRMELVKALRESVRCDLGDAKSVAFHAAVIPGSCNRCNASLPLSTLVDCDKCSSLNIQLGCTVPLLPCPACGFVVLGPTFGSYEICTICGWEDDAVQLANPTSGGGANSESLAEAQAKAMQRFPLQERVASGYRRDDRWRPLSPVEITQAEQKRKSEHWHSVGSTDGESAYWIRHPTG
jgi:hypothetical protein